MCGNKKLLAALMCLLLLCALCLPALAEEVPYIYYTKNDKTNDITRHDGKRTDATVLTGVETELRTGWYVAAGDVTFSGRPVVSGDVHLILKDNCKLTATYGITVNEGTAEDGKANSLSIFAQSEGEGMGALTVPGQGDNAGIGGTEGNSSGLITIHGGTVTATGYYGAGIGGGFKGSSTVEIYGGKVTTETYYGAGIGGGGGQGGDGTVTISGGTVTATANYTGAGIGGGDFGSGTVEISGGTVTATASRDSAAIGNGNGSRGGEVTITGGRVSAVNTNTGYPSIGGYGCTVSLGWKDADDYVYAAGYTGSVTLTKAFLIAGTTDTLPAGTVEDLSEIAGQVLLPNRSRTVRCIGYEWDEGKKRLTRKRHTVTNPRPLTGTETMLTGGKTEEEPVWYRVSGPVTLFARPEVRGHVNLILMDGCDLRAEKGITVNEGNFLSIFAQREGEGMGALTVPGQGSNAGIGGTTDNSSGLITIHGGKIDATAESGAGIGGGMRSGEQGGNGYVTIHGGTVTATANNWGAGIGGGNGGSGTVEIHGGTVTATANDWGAGIGGGADGDGTVTIHGGTVTATAMKYSHGAGIGGGYGTYNLGGTGKVTIYGGTVTATANYTGAGIGGGCGSLTGGSGTVEIYGGTVTATASSDSAGIGGGGGQNERGGSGEVKIYGGTVIATASDDGAGIGGGNGGEGKVEISGGTVTATASGDSAAIGNGRYSSILGIGSGGSVAVTGGIVNAVHMRTDRPSIGGNGCEVSLGLTKKNDSVYAAGYAAKYNTVTLTASLQDAGTGKKFPEEGDASPEEPAGIAADKLARKLLVPDTEEAARQQAWNDKAVTFRLPGSLGEIGKGAFQSIRAATVLVPQGVNKIGPDAFRGSGVKRIRFENGDPETFNASAFEGCPFVIVYTTEKGSVYDALKDKANVYIISR